MLTLETTAALQQALSPFRREGKTIGFVPTMGNLHEGHLSLIKKAKEEADIVVCSIFVNPLQFGANEDLDKYPRTLKADQQKLMAEGTDYLFFPTVTEMYPNGMDQQTLVSVPGVTLGHCGASRPGHFDGVSTVVTKLFNLVQPDLAVFGQKDFQQLAVIRKMVADLCMPIRIIGAPTGRASDGLALSSRNQYLNDQERALAPLLYKTLLDSQQRIQAEPNQANNIIAEAKYTLESAGFRADYLNLADAYNLQQVTENTEEVVILAALFLGTTRLIDNVSFPLNPRDI